MIWDKGTATNQQVLAFTIGNDQKLDLRLAPFDLLASAAHAMMLTQADLIKKYELSSILIELGKMHQKVQNGSFTIDDDCEDVHSQIEKELVAALSDIGKRIHTARSRNDQSLTAIRLYLRSETEKVFTLVSQLVETMLTKASDHFNTSLPGYTHMQAAMPSSFGLWLSGWAEAITDDLVLLHAAFRYINQNPLGSAAGYGTNLKIDRQITTDLLAFEKLSYASTTAQIERGKTEWMFANAIATIATTLARFCMDICMFAGPDMDFISLPEAFTTGSSIMPHKKNPDVFELSRARANRIAALPEQLKALTTNLPSGYHRDFQETKDILFPAIDQFKDVVVMLNTGIGQISPKPNLLNRASYQLLHSADVANNLVSKGTPFRDAYRQVAQSIADGTFIAPTFIYYTHQGTPTDTKTVDYIMNKLKEEEQSFGFGKIEKAFLYLKKQMGY